MREVVATFARRWANCLGATDGGDIGAARLPKSPKTSEVLAVCGRGFRLPTFWRTWLRGNHHRSGASQLPASRTPNPTRTRPNAARMTRALATPNASTRVRPLGVSTSSQSRFQNSAAPISAEPIPKMSDSLGITGFYRVGQRSAIGGQRSITGNLVSGGLPRFNGVIPEQIIVSALSQLGVRVATLGRAKLLPSRWCCEDDCNHCETRCRRTRPPQSAM